MTVAARGELLLHVGLGQSLLALTPRLRPLGAKPGLVDASRALVFGRTGDPRPDGNTLLDLPEAAFTGVVPHLRDGRSGPMTAAAAVILTALGPIDRLLSVNLARRNAALGDFGPDAPTGGFRNLASALTQAAALADAQGLGLGRLVVSWVQGQADRRTPRRVYLPALQRLVADVDALFAEVTGGRGRLSFCLSQFTAAEPPGRRCISLAQADLFLADPDRYILAGPEYMLERSDGVHLKPRSALYLGALHGRAIARKLSGEGWQPLHMVRAKVMGAAVVVTFAGGVGPLAADDGPAFQPDTGVGVRKLAHLGFGLQAPGQPGLALVGATVTGPREVRLDLSGPLTKGKALVTLGFPDGIGHPEGFVLGNPDSARGGATTLRTVGEPAPGLGLRLHDWALQQVITPGFAA